MMVVQTRNPFTRSKDKYARDGRFRNKLQQAAVDRCPDFLAKVRARPGFNDLDNRQRVDLEFRFLWISGISRSFMLRLIEEARTAENHAKNLLR
jgi:hypothetical protein